MAGCITVCEARARLRKPGENRHLARFSEISGRVSQNPDGAIRALIFRTPVQAPEPKLNIRSTSGKRKKPGEPGFEGTTIKPCQNA
jgi:hypothetical protein